MKFLAYRKSSHQINDKIWLIWVTPQIHTWRTSPWKEAPLVNTNCNKSLTHILLTLLHWELYWQNCNPKWVKLRYCETAKYKIWKRSHRFFNYFVMSKQRTKWEIFSNFCDLLRTSELYFDLCDWCGIRLSGLFFVIRKFLELQHVV